MWESNKIKEAIQEHTWKSYAVCDWIYDMQLKYFIVKERGKDCFTIMLILWKRNRTKLNNETIARNARINYFAQWGFVRLWLPVYFAIYSDLRTFVPLAVFINSTPCCQVYMTPFLKNWKSVTHCQPCFCWASSPLGSSLLLKKSTFISHPWELIGGFGEFALPHWERSLSPAR